MPRIDVAEELSRLLTHLDEVGTHPQTGAAPGKRLDFLDAGTQPRSQHPGVRSRRSPKSPRRRWVKLLIEQMREQIRTWVGMAGKLYVVAAPSGAGKTTLVRMLLATNRRVRLSISYSDPRPGGRKCRPGIPFHRGRAFREMIAGRLSGMGGGT